MRNLRAIYYKAIDDKRLITKKNENPFSDVFTGVVKTMKRALSLDEIKALHDLDLEEMLAKEQPDTPGYKYIIRLSRALRYFGFCCMHVVCVSLIWLF